jgi:hypothetical protein
MSPLHRRTPLDDIGIAAGPAQNIMLVGMDEAVRLHVACDGDILSLVFAQYIFRVRVVT